MAEGYADKISRDRAPRIHMTYNVETEGAIEKRELPFVMGVMSQLSGNAPTAPLKPIKDRAFAEINKTNFNTIMAGMNAGVEFDVDDKISGGDKQMHVKLKMNSMEDFSPASIVNQLEPLKKLKDKRDKLQALLSKANQYDKLEGLLEDILSKSGE